MPRVRLAPLLVSLLACAPAGPKVAPPPAAVAPPLPAAPATFRPIDAPPDGSAVTTTTPAGLVSVDGLGARWLVPKDGPPKRAADLDERHQVLAWVDGAGLVAIDEDRHVRVAKAPTDPWEDRGSVPADATDLLIFRGEMHVTVHGQTLVAKVGEAFHPLAPRGDRAIVSARVGANGVGAALALGGEVDTTTDGGAHWTAAPIAGVSATDFKVVSDRLFVVPGGDRDGFAREVDAQGKLVRGVVPDAPRTEPNMMYAPLRKRGPRYAAERLEIKDGETRRVALGAYGSETFAIDGDAVFTVLVSEKNEHFVGSGPLGGALTFHPLAALDAVCDLSPLHVRTCGGALLASCNGGYVVVDANGHATTVTANGDASYADVAFAAPTVLEAVLQTTRSGHNPDVATVELSIDGAAKGPPQPVDADTVDPFFVGKCAPSGPPAKLWLDAGSLYAARDDTYVSVGPRTTDTIEGLAGDRVLVARREAKTTTRFLVDHEGNHALLAVDPRVHHLAFAADGLHALGVGDGVFRSDDGGQTFVRIDAPKSLTGGSVLCGASRCVVADLAVYDGWGPAKLATDGDAKVSKPKLPAPIAQVTCQLSADREEPLKAAPIDNVGPALPPSMLVGTRDDDKRRVREAVFLSDTGVITARPLGRLVLDGDVGATSTAQTGIGAGIVRDEYGLGVSKVDFLLAPDVPMAHVSVLSYGGGSIFGRSFETDDRRVAAIDEVAGQLVFFSKKGAEKRDFPITVAGARSDANRSLTELADGRVVGLELAAHDATLFVADKTGRGAARSFVLASPALAEIGAAVVKDGEGAAIVVLEPQADGGAALRLRPIDLTTLEVGETKATLGTAAPGARFDVPACGDAARQAGADFALVTTRAARVDFNGASVAATLERTFRVTASSVCSLYVGFGGTGLGSGVSPAPVAMPEDKKPMGPSMTMLRTTLAGAGYAVVGPDLHAVQCTFSAGFSPP